MFEKTFYVRVSPDAFMWGSAAYSFYIYGSSEMMVLREISRIFEGINIAPTLSRWNTASAGVVRIGNSDPVVIHDCDRYSAIALRGGRRKIEKATPGQFRKSPDDIEGHWFTVFSRVLEDRNRVSRDFKNSVAQFHRHQDVRLLPKLEKMKATIDILTKWQSNIWAVYKLMQEKNQVTLPVLAAEMAF